MPSRSKNKRLLSLAQLDAKVNASLAEIHARQDARLDGIADSCVVTKDTVSLAAIAIIGNTSLCVDKKLNEIESYISDIYVQARLAMDDIKVLGKDGDDCISDTNEITQIPKAIVCLSTVTATATLALGNTIPSVYMDIAALSTTISNLQITLPMCLPISALQVLAQKAKGIAENIKDCIEEKIAMVMREDKNKSMAERPEAPINEQESSNALLGKRPEVQQPTFDVKSASEPGDLANVQKSANDHF